MRTHAPELLQNNSIFMFCNQSPRTFRDYAIDNYARVNIGNSFFAELRRRYGCFYRAEFGGWLNSNGANITYISTSHQPEDSKNVALGISDFYNELETILTDDVIKGAIERERFYLSKPEQINITISDLVKRKYQVDGGALDVGEYCDILGAIQPSEVREKIHEIFDGLCGVAVKGPEPMAMPDLDSIKKTFCRRQDVSREYKAAVAGPTCDIY
jgi:predicted Zn-dependent peptidase